MATVTGGAKFAKAMEDMARQLSRPATLRLGFLRNATYPDGKPVAMIAAIQEYGAPNVRLPKWLLAKALAAMTPEQRKAFAGGARGGRGIPPRPFFRNMIRDRSSSWPKALGAALKATNYNEHAALRMLGEYMRGQLQQSIRDTNTPPLSPITIALKGFAKPLIDTSHMINSVDYEIT